MEFILEKTNVEKDGRIQSLVIKYPTQKEAREVLNREYIYRKNMPNVNILHHSIDAIYYIVADHHEAFWFVKPYEEYKERD